MSSVRGQKGPSIPPLVDSLPFIKLFQEPGSADAEINNRPGSAMPRPNFDFFKLEPGKYVSPESAGNSSKPHWSHAPVACPFEPRFVARSHLLLEDVGNVTVCPDAHGTHSPFN